VLAGLAAARVGRRSSESSVDRLSILVRRVAAVAGTIAVFTGPIAAITWLEARAGGPFDSAFSSEGTLAQSTPAAITARILVEGAYGGTIHPHYTSAEWARFMRDGAGEQEQQALQNTEMLIFSSGEAASYIVYGVSSIVPVGGYTGNVPYPTLDQVQQLITSGKISFAILPANDVVTANDPRVKAVERLCTTADDPNVAPSYVIYSCGGGAGN